jgi:streptogramin lyase
LVFLHKRHRVNQRRSSRASFRPHLEELECRCLLSITEYPVAAGSAPIGIAAGPDGNLYYTEQTATTNAIGVMDTNGNVLREFPIPTPNSHSQMIVAGPDGNMWFAEINGGKLASISTDGLGTITEYALPSGNAPLFLTVGPDGNIWFSEGGNKIGFLDLAGGTYAITEYPVPTPSSLPIGIAAGPDGNIWFTEKFGNKVGKLDLAGGTFAFTEYTIPSFDSQPVGIVAGPDGNVWFTESGYGQIGVIDVAGGSYAITEYPIPTVFPFPQVIIAGPDGNMWFTETGGLGGYGNRLSSIDLVGGTYAITELAIPTADSQPVGLTVGPSGTDVWFAEVHGNQVGHYVSAPAPGGQRPGVHRSRDAADVYLASPSWDVAPVGANAGTLATPAGIYLASPSWDVVPVGANVPALATPAGDATDWHDYLGTPLRTQAQGDDNTPAFLAEGVLDALSEDVLISLVM